MEGFVEGVAVDVEDFTGNGHPDILLAGNLFMAEVETQRHDASIGLLLEGNGNGDFSPLPLKTSGINAIGDVKDLALLRDPQGKLLVFVARNDQPLSVFRRR